MTFDLDTPQVPAEIRDRWQLAHAIAQEAGLETLRYFKQSDLAVEKKSDASPVTAADRASETHLRQQIAKHFPHDEIVGEEFGHTRGDSGYRWILDPIDGTKSFICGVPLYSTLVGVDYRGESKIGVIHIPATGETAHAAIGGGAWYERAGAPRKAARVSSRSKLSDSILVLSQVDSFEKRHAAEVFTQLQAECYLTRTWGDGYGYLMVATGQADIMIDPIMNVWDAAAIMPVLLEAGGSFTDWQGNRTVFGGEGLATNLPLLETVLATTRKAPANPFKPATA
jgi:histidinol-phosphatase